LLGDIALADRTGEEAATTHYRTADGIANELGMRPLQVHCRMGLGSAARRAGRTEAAKAEFQAALEMAEALAMASAAGEARRKFGRTRCRRERCFGEPARLNCRVVPTGNYVRQY
jgi:hypothetical protein